MPYQTYNTTSEIWKRCRLLIFSICMLLCLIVSAYNLSTSRYYKRRKNMLRKHALTNTYIAPSTSFFESAVSFDTNLTTGRRVHFWDNLEVYGKLILGPHSSVKGDVVAESAVIGADARIYGTLSVAGNATILKGAVMDRIICGNNLKICEGVTAEYAESGGTIEMMGNASIKELGPGKVIAIPLR